MIQLSWKNNKICRLYLYSLYFNIAKMINIVSGCCDKRFPQDMWVSWVEVSPKIMITRLQEPDQFSSLTGHSWSSIIFEAPNKHFMSRKVWCAYKSTLKSRQSWNVIFVKTLGLTRNVPLWGYIFCCIVLI